MKQALVVTSFGTSVPEARSSITAVEKVLSAAAPGYSFVRVFTSSIIRRILAERGEDIPSLTEALEQLQAERVQRVLIQPTHVLYGYEYDKLKAAAEAVADSFEMLTVGRPLLADNGDILRFARQLSGAHLVEEDHAVVYMGHGTGHFANAAYPALQTALHFAGRDDIYIGTVEGWPGLADILRQLGAPRRVKLLPLMLVAGDHARNDMAGEWRERLEQVGHTVTCSFAGLGELHWVQEMYRERLEDMITAAG